MSRRSFPKWPLRPDFVLVNGWAEKHPKGAYLEWRNTGRRVRLSVGKDAQDAEGGHDSKLVPIFVPPIHEQAWVVNQQ
jgi:hypothetical protein